MDEKVKKALTRYRKERANIKPGKKVDADRLITAARITNAALMLAAALDKTSP